MGRNVKKGLEYYPIDVDIVSDIKIRKLIKRQKGQAFAVYTLLLCCIYKNGYYIQWDDDLPFILAEQTGFTEQYILQVINCCIDIGLFSAELYNQDQILTSRSIQERYLFICRQGKRKNAIQHYALISVDNNDMPQEENDENNNTPPQEDIVPKPTTKDIYTTLCKLVGTANRADVWEAAAITGNFQNTWTGYYQRWIQLPPEKKSEYPLYQLNQALRKQCGDVNIEWYSAIYWCKDNLLQTQFNEIYNTLSTKQGALAELTKLIKEVGRGKINNPGLFILSQLKKI